MAVGQHFNQAAYIGKYFSYLQQQTNVIGDYRNYLIEVLKLEDLFKLNNPNASDILNLIKPKPSYNLFSSGSIITKESEAKHAVLKTEAAYKFLDRELLFTNSNSDHIFIDYFSLHEARSMENYLTVRRVLFDCFFIQNKCSMNGFGTYFSHFKLIRNEKIKELIKRGIGDIGDFEKFSRYFFNIFYPLFWKYKCYCYTQNRIWFSAQLNDTESISFGTTPIVDFSDIQHSNIGQSNLFQQLSISTQILLKNSVAIIEKKNKISLGVNLSSKGLINLTGQLQNNSEILLSHILEISNFLSFFALTSSYKYLIFTSYKHKQTTVNNIVKIFNDLRLHYDENIQRLTVNSNYKY